MPVRGRTPLTTGHGCESCGSAVSELFRSRRTGLRVGRCRRCRLVSVLDRPASAELGERYASAPDYAAYLAAQRSEALHEWRLRTLDRIDALLDHPARTRPGLLFDVGAGAGDFLALARTRGFDVAGNELSEPATVTCAERHGIELHLGDLGSLPDAGCVDALTMWCVVAHVEDPGVILRDALRLLRPGGVLYLHTPRWCLLDTAGLAATRASRGRLSHLSDRRTNLAHLRLYEAGTMTRSLGRAGFEPVSVRPVVGYSLRTDAYLSSMGVPACLRGPMAATLDRLVEQGAFVRNVLEVYARRPSVAG